ncbi:TerB family tellurite resistance protein [Oscillatoriales cyanobacterium LEGE 11467]|uniref:TerB family tellurite resistance protein n=1 Tax=Zarconia navalis LEGE 11467 TaxID=1828826 RepID=A0A928VTS8_9CYAN|nr:TerB family tellurite resistance protein [Zarconia navalis]MBE9039183.1 TerB family tellurite resistance protein [Zarconia navalis LEGE 11467]
MQRVPINPEAIELLGQIAGSQLDREGVTGTDIFSACLVWVLLGTLFVDGKLEERETQQLQTVLDRIIDPKSDRSSFIQAVLQGIRQKKIDRKPEDLRILSASLSVAEKLLLVGFSCQMSSVDGQIHLKERQYVGAIASYLQVNDKYVAVFEANFGVSEAADDRALKEVYDLLDPTRFPSPDSVLVEAARYLREHLLAN